MIRAHSYSLGGGGEPSTAKELCRETERSSALGGDKSEELDAVMGASENG